MNSKEAAARIGVTMNTLARYRQKRLGPPYEPIKGRIHYSERGVQKWIAAIKAGKSLVEATAACEPDRGEKRQDAAEARIADLKTLARRVRG